MAKISFSAQAAKHLSHPAVGWHLFEIISDREAVSKDKASINYILGFEVVRSAVDDSEIGKECERLFNNKPKAISFLRDFLAAVWVISIDQANERIKEFIAGNEEFDLEILKGKKVWNEVIEEPYEERMVKKMGDNWLSEEESPPF